MKVFISWSGEKSKAVALAFRKWLPDVIQTIDPWMSQHDIDAGARWNAELAEKLSKSRFGVLCITKSNVTAPWLLFEAGALAKTLEQTFVCPYLIDLTPTEIPAGPLTQFQAKRSNQSETLELVEAINKALGENALPEDKIKRSFDRWWPDLKTSLESLPTEELKASTRPVPEMIEEILSMVRGLSRQAIEPNKDRDRVYEFSYPNLNYPKFDQRDSQTAADYEQILRTVREILGSQPPEPLIKLTTPAVKWRINENGAIEIPWAIIKTNEPGTRRIASLGDLTVSPSNIADANVMGINLWAVLVPIAAPSGSSANAYEISHFRPQEEKGKDRGEKSKE